MTEVLGQAELPSEHDLQDGPDAWQAALQELRDIGDLHAAYAAGREDESADRDARWNEIARPVARGGPAHAELERRRWTVRGEQRTQETFGQPHPDDYMGQDA